jgi:hypothetical protein
MVKTPARGQDPTTKLIASARALGVTIDRDEAGRWVRALSAENGDRLDADPDTFATMSGHPGADGETAGLEQARRPGGDAIAGYVELLTEEVYRYTVHEPNFGKAARRMHNIFRLTGRFAEADFIRDLFDEPTTALYQAAAVLRTLNGRSEDRETGDGDALAAQVDRLIMSAIGALDGRAEDEMVQRLMAVRAELSRLSRPDAQGDELVYLREAALVAVNDYFERALTANPSIYGYLKSVAAAHGAPRR